MNLKQKLTLGALALTLPLNACYGKFALTRKVYEFNGQLTDNKFIHSLTTWVFLCLPVYSLAGLADFVVLNVIEFWSGENPLGAKVEFEKDGLKVTSETKGDEMTLTYFDAEGNVTQTMVVRKVDMNTLHTTTYDAQGNAIDENIVTPEGVAAPSVAMLGK